MNDGKAETAFLEDLARSLDHWTESAVSALTDPASDLAWTEAPESFRRLQDSLKEPRNVADLRAAVADLLRGQIHSVLVSIDGGTALAEDFSLSLQDQHGTELGPGLHEKFVSHLFETGRLH
jgi:hypothetical protein